MRKRRYDDSTDIIGDVFGFAAAASFLYLFFEYLTDRAEFWRLIWYISVAIFVFSFGFFLAMRRIKSREAARWNALLGDIKQKGLEGEVLNFINRFGLEKSKKGMWGYMGYNFEFYRINFLEELLKGKEVKLNDKKKDIYSLLRYYIRNKQRKSTLDNVGGGSKSFDALSGEDFEKLLFRLFDAMGYSTEHKGGVGDQGADLIITKDRERILVQAKRYGQPVGNKAVQEAVAAQKFYDCNRAMVVTNSIFTPEAIALARANDVILVSRNELHEKLSQYLKENWN